MKEMYVIPMCAVVFQFAAVLAEALAYPRGVLLYMGYIGMCRCEGYGFQAVYSRIGYINQRVWVQNVVSFFRKLISWLKILCRLVKQLLQDRGDLGVYSSIGQQNSTELALVQVNGSGVPVVHPLPRYSGYPRGIMGTLKPVGQLYGPPTALASQYMAWDHYRTCLVQTSRVEE